MVVQDFYVAVQIGGSNRFVLVFYFDALFIPDIIPYGGASFASRFPINYKNRLIRRGNLL